jgi:hypothetical protein
MLIGRLEGREGRGDNKTAERFLSIIEVNL